MYSLFWPQQALDEMISCWTQHHVLCRASRCVGFTSDTLRPRLLDEDSRCVGRAQARNLGLDVEYDVRVQCTNRGLLDEKFNGPHRPKKSGCTKQMHTAKHEANKESLRFARSRNGNKWNTSSNVVRVRTDG